MCAMCDEDIIGMLLVGAMLAIVVFLPLVVIFVWVH